jgi:cobalamin biosynthesis protein CbiG
VAFTKEEARATVRSVAELAIGEALVALEVAREGHERIFRPFDLSDRDPQTAVFLHINLHMGQKKRASITADP